jgi:general secretion pathway protein D
MVSGLSMLAACAGIRTVDQSVGHIMDSAPEPLPPPAVVAPPPEVQRPVPSRPVETYSVVAKDVPVGDLLFSLARDAGLDLDMQSSVEGNITINAVDQPLQNVLARVVAQAGLRFEMRGRNLIVVDDLPYWHNYRVDYVNVSRSSEGEVGVATEISTAGGTVGEDNQQQGGRQGNLSKSTVKNTSNNDFWTALQSGLTSIVTRDQRVGDSPESTNPIIVNPMAGVVTLFATQTGHQQVQTYLDSIMSSAKRQVLIEMTIVEVELSDRYQAGVDWQKLASDEGLSIESDFLGGSLTTAPFVELEYTDTRSNGDTVTGTVRMLQQFGDTKVLSSPKIMALNNQTALLKVVNEEVYFTIELDIRDATVNIPERRTFTSEIHTIPVGLVMSVTPQISNSGYVSLNIRPTISRVTGFAVDPGPRLAEADFDNLIPEIQVREIESLLQVLDGNTIVLGGLMQNEEVKSRDGIPGLSKIPKIGGLFSYTKDDLVKTELVIFLRPTIVTNGMSPAGSPTISDYYKESTRPFPGTVSGTGE